MREGTALTEQSFRPSSLSYQSFRAHIQDNAQTTADLVLASGHVIVGATQIKIVGVILLGFSLVALLQNPITEEYSTWYDSAAKTILGLSVAITFMTTTYTICEAHYLSTLSSVAGRLAKDKDDSMNEEDGAASEDDHRLANKFRALLVDLEILRGWTRVGLWLSMLLLVLATLLRLGRGDLGFVFIGIATVLLILGASAWPVVMRLRNLYAPLIKEYRGLVQGT